MKKITLTILAVLMAGIAVAQTKAVSILGDSYSTYEDFVTPATNELWYYAKNSEQKTDVKDVRQTWWHQLIKENGWRLAVNNSYSGATISYTGYDGNDYSPRSFNTRMDNLGQPDIIFIFGATNDSWAGSPIGDFKYEGIKKADLYEFRPALAHMLRWMTDRYEHYGVPVITLTEVDKISGHPSVKGMRQIADQVNSFLKSNAK